MDSPYRPAILYGTISSGGSVSTPIDLNGYTLCAFSFPGTIAGSVLTFQAADYSGTYKNVYSTSGVALQLTYGNSYMVTDILELAPLRNIKLVTSGTQTADRVIGVLVK